MIKELQHIVTLYLDPTTYRTLNQYKPKKYNKLQYIIENYELAIPELTKFEIMKSGIKLKLTIVDSFNTILNNTNIIQKCCFECRNLINNWYNCRIKDLFAKYNKLNYDCIDLTIYRGQVNIILKNKFNEKIKHIISYPNNEIEDFQVYETKNSVIILQQKHKELSKQEFINYLPIFYRRENISEADIYGAYAYVANLNFLETKEDEKTYNISKKYYDTTLFNFVEYDTSLISMTNVDKSQIPNNFLQSLYYIMQTVDQFYRIVKSYERMLSPKSEIVKIVGY